MFVPARLTNVPQGNRLAHRLDDHESFLICPGKPTFKLDTGFPVSSVRVFYRKIRNSHDVRSNSVNADVQNYIDIYHYAIEE